jgi:hypothetical protein
MDKQHFDDLARAFGRSLTRRRVISAVAGLAGLGSSAVSAKRARSKSDGAKPSARQNQGWKTTICHKPGTRAEQTLTVSPSAVDAHLRHGDHLGACCPAGAVFCDGSCCAPPPQGGEARCCPDGSCGCAGACCADACFWDNRGGPTPVEEFCCLAPDREICKTDEKLETCCPANNDCSCASGIAGSYKRPGR